MLEDSLIGDSGEKMCEVVREYQRSYHTLMTIDIDRLQAFVERVKLEIRMTAAAIVI